MTSSVCPSPILFIFDSCDVHLQSLIHSFVESDVSLKLPPRPYAFYLLHVFEEGYRDYHWYLRNRFRVRLSQTYSDPESQAMDRNWLCRVSVVLALAEAWNYGRTSPLGLENEDMPRGVRNAYAINNGNGHWASSDSTSEASSQPLPPGSALFEQALLLLKTPCEEPVLEDVEALNLIVSKANETIGRSNQLQPYKRSTPLTALPLGLLLLLTQQKEHGVSLCGPEYSARHPPSTT